MVWAYAACSDRAGVVIGWSLSVELPALIDRFRSDGFLEEVSDS